MKQFDLVSLSECSLFQSVDILDLQAFFKSRSWDCRGYHPGEIPVTQGEPYDALIILLRGKVSTAMTAPNGKVVRLETLQGPSAIGTAVLFSGQRSLPVSLEVLEPSDCLFLQEKTVMELMHEFPSFLKAYLTDNGDRLLLLAEKIRLFQFKSLRQKIASHLLVQSERQRSDEFFLIYSREDLSQLMGVARPSLSREFSSLVKENLISVKGKSVKILNREGLLRTLQEV